MLVRELAHLLAHAIRIERRRLKEAPGSLLAEMRACGRSRTYRQPAARRRLQRAIRFVDRLFPSGPNCFRRALIEISMDAGAALEPVHFGLKSKGGPRSGHAWLASDRRAARYDAEFVL